MILSSGLVWSIKVDNCRGKDFIWGAKRWYSIREKQTMNVKLTGGYHKFYKYKHMDDIDFIIITDMYNRAFTTTTDVHISYFTSTADMWIS